VLEFVDAALDEVPLAIDCFVVAPSRRTFARWNYSFRANPLDEIDHPLGIVSFVGEYMTTLLARDELLRRKDVVSVPSLQEQPKRTTGAFDREVDLAAQSAARAPERLILSPPFAPAAC